MPTIDSTQIILSARAGVYRTLQNVFGNEPTTDMLEQITGSAVKSVLSFFDNDMDVYRESIDRLFASAEECLKGGSEALSKLEGRFTRLFVGPGGTEGIPWESYYLSTDKMLFQKEALEVRKAYIEQKLIPRSYPNVSDDHIAIELDFLAKLAERAEGAWNAGDAAETLKGLTASEEFLRDHLAKWVGPFRHALGKAKHGAAFYYEAAFALESFIPIDLDVIAEIRRIGQTS